jgi:hypothetical protein
MNANKRSLVLIAVCFALAIGAIIMFNRAQPSEKEVNQAQVLVAALNQLRSTAAQTILYEAAAGVVTLNAYGFMDTASQDAVVTQLKRALIMHPYDGQMVVNFCPPREVETTLLADGSRASVVKKAECLRRVTIR